MNSKLGLKISLLFIGIFIIYFHSLGQGKKIFLRSVNVPDTIRIQLLKNTYHSDEEGFLFIFNLQKRKDFTYKDGIYSYKGSGPHFPRKIFIANTRNVYIFKNDAYINPKGILEEFVNNVSSLNLTDKQIVKYAKVISEYLDEELGLTYGSDIK